MTGKVAIRYFEHKDLPKLLRRMHRDGGKLQKAADEVHAIRQKIRDGEDPFKNFPQTNNGETRIDHCVKYDLTGYARLVTIRQKNFVCLRFVGDHPDVDRWLDNNRGLKWAISSDNDIREISISADIDEPKKRIAYQPDNFNGPILSRLDQVYRTRLFGDLPSRITEPLRDVWAGTSEESLLYLVSPISDERLRKGVFDVLVCLNSGDIQGAQDRIDVEELSDSASKLTLIDDLSEDQILHIRDGEIMRDIQVGSPEYEKWIDRYERNTSELDWFLFMHPDQEKFVVDDYLGPAKLSGVSGSGKTCIAIRRAVRLANAFPGEDIAILTLNRSLSSMISRLVEHVCPPERGQKRIKVYSFFGLCQELLREFEQGNEKLYSDVTWGLEEHIDEVFREFYRCQAAFKKAEILKPLHRSLTALGIDAETYLREEFDWIRSAVPADDRARYLELERSGRVYRIDRHRREPIVAALGHWEEKMRAVGVIDYLGLTTALHRHRSQITPRFRSIIVDEVQDFGTTELELIRRLVAKQPNDIFLCGDLAQHILPKHQAFVDAGIEVTGRAHTIKRNYRNTREILKAAYEILYSNLDEALLRSGDMEFFDPEFATRSSSQPSVLAAISLEQEIACAIALIEDNAAARQARGEERGHRGCIAIAGYSLFEIKMFGEKNAIPVLDGSRDFAAGDLFLSDLEQTKGYEFDTVVVVNCSAEMMPPTGAPKEETYRYATQLYVAMTRARDQLVLSYSGVPSRWLSSENRTLHFDDWSSFIDLAAIKHIGKPGYLSEVPDSDDIVQAVMKMTGQEFSYTVYARGLPSDVQDKLEELVSGRSVVRGRERVSWESVGQLQADMQMPRRSGHIFGPSADKLVFDALERASSGSRVTAVRPYKKREVTIRPLPALRGGSQYRDTSLTDASVRTLGLPSEVVEAIEAVGVRNIRELLAVSKLELSRSPILGAKRMERIRAALKSKGFIW